MVDVTGGSVAGGAVATPPARLDLAEARSATAKTLMALFAGGGPISGRVEAQLNDTTWSIVVRGRTLVAESALPLRPDQVVQLALDQLADGQVRVRLAGDPATVATRSAQNPVLQRLAALGLPATPAAEVVLKAFIAAGAPLDPARLRAAIEVVGQAQSPAPNTSSRPSTSGAPTAPGAPSSSSAVSQLADAADGPTRPSWSSALPAAIPAFGLPVTATKAALNTPSPPGAQSPSSAVPLRADVADAPTRPSWSSALPAAITSSGLPVTATKAAPNTPSPPGAPSSSSAEPQLVDVADAPTRPSQRSALPAAITSLGLPVTATKAAPNTPNPPGAPGTSPAEPQPANVAEAPTLPSQRSALPAATPSSGLPITTRTTTAAPPSTATPPGTPSPSSAEPPTADAADVPTQPRPALPAATLATAHALLARADLPTTPALVRLAATTVTPGLPNLSASLAQLPAAIDRLLPHLPPAQAEQVRAALSAVPKPADLEQGPPAAERALRQSGVVPIGIPAPDAPPASPIRLVQALAELALALREAEATAPSETARANASSASEAVHHSTREATAEQVFKPRDLSDYDRILQLPLTSDGRPLPTRVAIATRSSGGGERAAWVRIDTDMSHLGPVSVRLSGGAGGPIAITLVAEPHAAEALAAGLPDLAVDLRKRGIVAVLRVAAPSEADHG